MSGKAKKVREKKETTLFLAVIPILAMIVLLGVGYAVMGLSPEVLMLVSAAIAGVIAIYLGYTWDEIMDSIVAKLSKTMPAIFILIIVGFMIGSWMIGGTIPMMVFYGLKLISPKYLVVTSFLVTAFVSVCTGTSWGLCGNDRCCSDGRSGRYGSSSSDRGRRHCIRCIFRRQNVTSV